MDTRLTRPRDTRRGPKIAGVKTGRKPLRYDRHGDLEPTDDFAEGEFDPAGLLGDRWFARRIGGGG